jgi:hypothetical protein
MSTVTKHGNMPAAKIEGTDAEFGPLIGVPTAGPAMARGAGDQLRCNLDGPRPSQFAVLKFCQPSLLPRIMLMMPEKSLLPSPEAS